MADLENLQKDEHGCIIGKEVWDETTQQCVPIPQKKPVFVSLGGKRAKRR